LKRKIGTVDDFPGLSPEESAYIDMKFALSRSLKGKRVKQRLNQVAFTEKIDSSQSRVAKMETSDPSVSIDLLMKSLRAPGASKKGVAKVISSNFA
jgi:hypothetical protein